MPLTLGLSILVKRKPPPPANRLHGSIARPRKVETGPRVEIGNPKEDSEVLLRRVLETKDIKLLPGGDGFNADERLNRDRVLTLLDRLFDSDTALAKLKRPTNTPPDCYMIVYSGPGEEGDWLLNEKSMDKLTLMDILDRWTAARHYERGAVLYILSDCDKSGLWVNKADALRSTHVFLQASCGANEIRGMGKAGQDEQFLKAWSHLQLGLMAEEELDPVLQALGQAGARVFAPYGFNFPPVAWVQSLAGVGERLDRKGGEEELAPLYAFLRECMGKAEQLQPLTNMPVAAERPRLLQSPEDASLTESKRRLRTLVLARTSPSINALQPWGKPEVASVGVQLEDLANISAILRRYVLHEDLAVAAVQLLWRLSWHEEFRAPVVQAGALETVFKALELHVQNPTLVCAACGLVCRVRVTAGFRHKVLAVRGIETLVMAMRSQEDKADVQRFGCVALNVVASPPDPPMSQGGDALAMQPLPLSPGTCLEAVETCISVLDGPVGAVAEVANAAMGAAQGILHLDEHARKTPKPLSEDPAAGWGLPPREDSSGTMELAVPKLVRGIAKVLAVHAEDPAVMRQACQLLDTVAAGRFKSSLHKPAGKPGDPDFVRSLLAGILTHRNLDDVAWQLLSTMATLVQFPALKTRLVHAGARTALLQYPKQRAHEMPRWLEGVFQTFHDRVSARE